MPNGHNNPDLILPPADNTQDFETHGRDFHMEMFKRGTEDQVVYIYEVFKGKGAKELSISGDFQYFEDAERALEEMCEYDLQVAYDDAHEYRKEDAEERRRNQLEDRDLDS